MGMGFGLKDCFTLGSVAVAAYAVLLAFEGDTAFAALCVLYAWLFDALDGLVARLTNTGNAFGAKLDDVADHISYSVAPAFVVYGAYRSYSRALAFALCFYLLAVGTVRLARGLSQPVSYPGYWLGFPRSAAAFTICFLLNSQFFRTWELWIPAAVLIVALGTLLLTYIPYRNHKKPMRHVYRVLLWLVALVCIAAYRFGYMWDLALFFSVLYLLSPLVIVSRAEHSAIRQAVAAARAA